MQYNPCGLCPVMPLWLIVYWHTKRPLKKRIAEHIHNIKIGFKDHSVSLRFKQWHNRDPSGLRFRGIDKVHPFWRGINRVRELSKCETKWIDLTNTLSLRGMNIKLDMNCFIRDFFRLMRKKYEY